jgi:hypothetical protein
VPILAGFRQQKYPPPSSGMNRINRCPKSRSRRPIGNQIGLFLFRRFEFLRQAFIYAGNDLWATTPINMVIWEGENNA